MRIQILSSAQAGTTSSEIVQISHNGQVLNWDISPYSRSRDAQGEAAAATVFDEINSYLEQVSAERQHKIFETFRAIREELNQGYDTRPLTVSLQRYVEQLYNLMPFEDVEYWVRMSSNLRVPPSIKHDHSPEDPKDEGYIAQTYLYRDYQQLMALTVALRPMVPIWGEFLKAIKETSGNTNKEQVGMKLLYFSSLIKSEPMTRLYEYIIARATAQYKTGPSQAALMGGMGSSELPDWLRAITVVRRLTVCPIVSQEEHNNLVTNIHQFLRHNLTGLDKKFGGQFNGSITDKERSANTKDDSNDSLVEMYKIKAEIPDGEAQKMSIYPEYLQNLIDHIDPTLPREYVDQCMEAITTLQYHSIEEHQSRLMRWVMSPAIPHEGAALMPRTPERLVMAVIQAALWHWGFYSLAVLMTATPVVREEGVMLGGTELRGRMSKELDRQLQEAFPHYRQPRQVNAPSKHYNPAVRAIEKFCSLAARNEWMLHAPLPLKKLATRPEFFMRYEITAEIRTALAELLTKITK